MAGLGGRRQHWKARHPQGKRLLGDKGPARWSRRLWSRLGLGAGAWIPAAALFLLLEGPGRVGEKEPGTLFGGRGRGCWSLLPASYMCSSCK